ncbi:MAG: hypothetical protein QOE82_2173 [Thermoanaerobaculia bacterium]|jgi:hypothetical protein|nr:hypothetical protein [Thermoanaerobaculia bacterium]
MSYLDRPRLHFFGTFTANPSTINNTAANYDMNQPLGPLLWNPTGQHNFSINACPITSIVMDGGDTETGTVDTAQTGVLVDLDTEQQMVSMVFGMILEITVGTASVTGTFRPVNFFDIIFGRANGAGGDEAASAAYQSVLTDLQWSNASQSTFLSALYAASPKMLSIRFIVDGFHNVSHHGRVAGTIGPYFDGEPMTFANARFLRPTGLPSQFGPFNYAPAKTDLTRGVITFDLGNAVPTSWPPNPTPPPNQSTAYPVAAGFPLQVALIDANGNPTTFGDFDTSETAYESNAFVQEFQIPPNASNPLASTPTGIVSPETPGPVVVMMENPTGAYVNSDQYVFRLNPGERGYVPMWANIFEVPAAGAEIFLYPYPNMLQLAPGAPVGTPSDAVSYPASVTTDSNGKASFTIHTSDPGNPRGFIDGQVYGIGFTWAQDVTPDPNAYISVHVFQQVPVPSEPTWWQDVYPILNQYSRLYPSMQARIKLNDYQAVVNSLQPIVQRLLLDSQTSPQYMPITRELSRDKTAIILLWAENGHPEGTPPTTS